MSLNVHKNFCQKLFLQERVVDVLVLKFELRDDGEELLAECLLVIEASASRLCRLEFAKKAFH